MDEAIQLRWMIFRPTPLFYLSSQTKASNFTADSSRTSLRREGVRSLTLDFYFDARLDECCSFSSLPRLTTGIFTFHSPLSFLALSWWIFSNFPGEHLAPLYWVEEGGRTGFKRRS